MKVWFVLQKGEILGPMDSLELAAAAKNGLQEDCLFWWKGFKEWELLSSHSANLPNFLEEQTQKLDAPIWQLRFGDSERGSFNYQQLIDHLQQITDPLKNVLVKTVHENGWQPLFVYPDLMESLGISLRNNLRVALDAEVSVSMEKKLLKGFASTVSMAGIGVKNLPEILKENETVKLQIKASHFSSTIHVHARVAYSKARETGFVFESLHPEYQSMLSYHIRKLLPENFQEQKKAV